ncbi:MAG: CpaD family pilus assembly protein [Pseudolabrys sp.]|nr:CpaD family pilus assembly protein [Pseudolabrys sp.]
MLAIGGLAMTLAGCYSTRENTAANYPNDYRVRHPITMKEGDRTVEVFLGRNRGGLSASQRADVLAFANSWKRESTGGILIEVPSGGPTSQAAADSLREIHSILAASAVPRHGVTVRTYAPSPFTITSIKLNYPKLVAEAGPCGKWPNDLGPADDATYSENKPYWNLGCASQRNLASMIDNPADLVQPRGETAAYSNRRSVALEKYRKGESPSAIYPNDASNGYDAGKISDLGK